MKKLSIFTMILAALVMASCDRSTLPGGETPVGDATISVKISGSASTRAFTDEPAVTVANLRIIIADASGNIVTNKTNNDSKVENIVVPIGTYTFLAIANQFSGDTAALNAATKVAQVQAIVSSSLDAQYGNDGENVLLTGYVEDIKLKAGQNYLGYESGTGTVADATYLDAGGTKNAFYVYRLVSMVEIKEIVNNTNGRLKIEKIYILNAKNSVYLFPNDFTSKTYFDVIWNIAAPTTDNTSIDATFSQGAAKAAFTAFGQKFPKYFGPDVAVGDKTYTDLDDFAANGNLTKTLDPALNYGAGITNAETKFYVYPNYQFTMTPSDDHATMLVIEGSWSESGDGTGAGTVYYPIVINKSVPGTTLSDGDDNSKTNKYIARNRKYEITKVTIGSKGVDNPWTESIAYLDVMVTIGAWDATITQTVEF